MTKKFYITTAIDYVNSKPHIGTAYEKIGADVIARYKRLCGFDVYFQMGNDEHSINVAKAAEKQGLEPLDYCNKMEKEFRDAWSKLNINYDYFIRTTEKRHEDGVQHLLKKIADNDDIYKHHYEGWYCNSCEAFLREDDLVDGQCPTHGNTPNWIKEENYFFRLSKYEDKLLNHIQENPNFIQPESRKNEMLNLIKSGLEDISISRSSEAWGIPLPIDESQVIYVWIDALINYITGIGYPDDTEKFDYYWPADLHVIGKDITRFHCVIWPAMLMSAGIQLPKTVWGHGFVYLKGEKMSKTKGTVVDPLKTAEEYGTDTVRFFLMREVPFDRDGDFSYEGLVNRYNTDLANDLGNLLSRTVTMIVRYLDGKVPENSDTTHMEKVATDAQANYKKYMDEYEFHNALEAVWEIIRFANRQIEEKKPWELAKDESKAQELANVLYSLLEGIRFATILLFPIIPQKAQELWNTLKLEGDLNDYKLADLKFGEFPTTIVLEKPEPIFPRMELDQTPKKKAKKQSPKKKQEERTNVISIEEFAKIDLRVAEVLEAEKVPKSNKLIKMQISLGEEQRQIVAGIGKDYTAEELVGEKIVVVANLQKAKIFGVESQGMLLAAKQKDQLVLVQPGGDIPAGARIS